MMRWLISFLCLIIYCMPLYAQNNEPSSTIIPLYEFKLDDALDVVTFQPDSTQLATGGRDNAVRLWDTATGENTAILSGHSDWISSLAYSPDGTVLASGGRDNNIWLWNVQTGTSLRLIEDHQAEVKAITFTPDGNYLISGSLDGIVRLEPIGNPEATQLFNNFGGGVWSLALSPDGKTLAIGSDDSTIWLIGLWSAEGTWLTPLNGHDTPVTSLAWSADGEQILSGEQNGHVRLWDVRNVKNAQDPIDSLLLQGHLAPITAVDFTIHEDLLISSALDGTIRLWDTTNISELTTLYQTFTPLTHFSLNSSRELSASISTAGYLKLWSLERNILEDIIEEHRPVIIPNTPVPVVEVVSAPNQASASVVEQAQTSAPIAPLPNNSSPTLMIPSVGMQVGIKTFPLDGVSWAIDPYEPLVGHLQGTSWVNGNGNVALAGHSLYPNGRAGVFNSLYNVNLGDEIVVQDGEIVRRYIVSDIRVVDYTDVSVIYPTGHHRVTLITCDIPSFQSATGLYGERLVVIADAVN